MDSISSIGPFSSSTPVEQPPAAPHDISKVVSSSISDLTSSMPNKPNNSFTQDNELDFFLEKKNNEIENHLAQLGETVQGEKIFKAFNEAEKFGKKQIELADNITDFGFSAFDTLQPHLEKYLPKELVESMIKNEDLDFLPVLRENFKDILETGMEYAKAIDIGADVLALIYRQKIVNKSHEVLEKLETKLNDLKKNNGNQSDIDKLQKMINELKSKLSVEEDALLMQKAKAGISLGKFSLKTLKSTTQAFFEKGSQGLQVVAAAFSIAGSFISSISASFNLYKSRVDYQAFNQWDTKYKDWEASNSPLKDVSQTLSNKKMTSTEKVKQLKSTFDEIYPKILELKLPAFEQDIKKLQAMAEDPAVSMHELKDFLKKMYLPEELLKIENLEDLKQALANLSKEELRDSLDKLLKNEHSKISLIKFYDVSQYLLNKRMAHSEKVRQLETKFDEIYPKILELKLPAFEQDIKKLETMAGDPDISIYELHYFIKKMYLPVDLFKIDNPQDLKQALANLTKEEVRDSLDKLLENEYEKSSLIKFYVDAQETIELTTKNALKELVTKKNAIESSFVDYKNKESKTLFVLAQATAAVSVTLAIIGLATTPVAGAGFILLGLSAASTIFSIGFFIAGSYFTQLHRAHKQDAIGDFLTRTAHQIKTIYNNIKLAIRQYQQISNRKKIEKRTEMVNEFIQKKDETSEKYIEAKKKYEEATLEYAKRASKIEKWLGKLDAYQKKMEEAGWQDFAAFALNRKENVPEINFNSFNDYKHFLMRAIGLEETPLPTYTNPFDTLKAFSEAVSLLDLNILSPETKILFEQYLGINPQELQTKLESNPDAVKKGLQKFFMMDDSAYVKFIQLQKARLEHGII